MTLVHSPSRRKVAVDGKHGRQNPSQGEEWHAVPDAEASMSLGVGAVSFLAGRVRRWRGGFWAQGECEQGADVKAASGVFVLFKRNVHRHCSKMGVNSVHICCWVQNLDGVTLTVPSSLCSFCFLTIPGVVVVILDSSRH